MMNNFVNKPNFLNGNFIKQQDDKRYRYKTLSEIVDLTIGDISDMKLKDIIREEIKNKL